MNLSKYILENQLSAKRFAERVGVAEASVSRWLSGSANPTYENIQSIAIATNYQVMPNDWFSELYAMAGNAQKKLEQFAKSPDKESKCLVG